MSLDRSPAPDDTWYDQSMSEAAGALWQLPFTVFTGWWNLMIAPWLPTLSQHRHTDAHDQLVVPDALEEAGEHALFA